MPTSFALAGELQSSFLSCKYQGDSWSARSRLEQVTHRHVSYICSRIFLTNPPGKENTLQLHPAAPDALKEKERHLAETEPETNSWVCLCAIVIAVGLLAVTSEFLVDTLEPVREEELIGEEWVQWPGISFR